MTPMQLIVYCLCCSTFGGGAVPRMALSEANALLTDGTLDGTCRVADALCTGALGGTPRQHADIAWRTFESAGRLEENEQRFVGGTPLRHSAAQIRVLLWLRDSKTADSYLTLQRITTSFLDDFEGIGAASRKASPLQALQMPLAQVLIEHREDPRVSHLVRRFVTSAAIKEYAKWELAMADVRSRVIEKNRVSSQSTAVPENTMTEKLGVVVNSVAQADVVQLAQSGKRIEACCQLVSELRREQVDLLDWDSGNRVAVTDAERYLVACCVVNDMLRKLVEHPSVRDDCVRRVNASIDEWVGLITRNEVGKYGAFPLRKALLQLEQTIEHPGLTSRLSDIVVRWRAMETAPASAGERGIN